MGAFPCSPQARQLILQYGLTLSDLDRHPEVRDGLLCLTVSFLCGLCLTMSSGYLPRVGERSVHHTSFSLETLSINPGWGHKQSGVWFPVPSLWFNSESSVWVSWSGLDEPWLHPGFLPSVLGQMYDSEPAHGAYHHVEKRSDRLRCHAHVEMGYSEFYGKDDYTPG